VKRVKPTYLGYWAPDLKGHKNVCNCEIMHFKFLFPSVEHTENLAVKTLAITIKMQHLTRLKVQETLPVINFLLSAKLLDIK
jgi:hypothetical protein